MKSTESAASGEASASTETVKEVGKWLFLTTSAVMVSQNIDDLVTLPGTQKRKEEQAQKIMEAFKNEHSEFIKDTIRKEAEEMGARVSKEMLENLPQVVCGAIQESFQKQFDSANLPQAAQVQETTDVV